MTKVKDISAERRLTISLNHVTQAERQVNLVTINNKALTDHLTKAKKILLYILSTLNGANPS
ncbi:MAG: hypothetical protein ACTSWU_02780 [Candidatus Thorarchaeota archaeon]